MKSKLEIEVITVGKLKEAYLREAEEVYLMAIGRNCKIRVLELKDEKTKDGAGQKELSRVKDLEGEGILKKLDAKAMIIAMDIGGRKVSTAEFRDTLDKVGPEGKVQFVIGGSLGLSENVLQMATKSISFGEMTYPHQLFRIMLLEEILNYFRVHNEY